MMDWFAKSGTNNRTGILARKIGQIVGFSSVWERPCLTRGGKRRPRDREHPRMTKITSTLVIPIDMHKE
jgi:hypothetical protein